MKGRQSSLADTPLIDKRPRKRVRATNSAETHAAIIRGQEPGLLARIMADPSEGQRMKAAQARAKVAIAHLEKARAELDAACTDLSSVVGLAPIYDIIRKLSIGVLNARRTLDSTAHADADKIKLDHVPTPQELHCGHGPKHGCGKGRR